MKAIHDRSNIEFYKRIQIIQMCVGIRFKTTIPVSEKKEDYHSNHISLFGITSHKIEK